MLTLKGGGLAIATLSAAAVAQPFRISPIPPPTPGRIIVVAPPAAQNADADAWIILTELALDAHCIWRSRIAPHIAVFDHDESGSAFRFSLAPELSWLTSVELDDHATLQSPCTQTPTVNDPLFSEQWFIRNTGQPFGKSPGGGQFTGLPGSDARIACAWGNTFGAEDVVIAVIDNGVDGNHPDLAPSQIWYNKREEYGLPGVDDDNNGFKDDIVGWDFYDWDNDPLCLSCPDPEFCPDPSTTAFTHGTPVAGIIAAHTKNALGVAGIATRCRIMSLKITGDDWNAGHPGLMHILMAMDYAAANGAQVANCSFAWAGRSSAMEAMCIAMGSRGTLVVAAAGNDGLDIGIPANYVSPAVFAKNLDNVISVGGCFAHDEFCANGACSYASNFSSSYVSLAAPGYQLWSADRVLGAEPSPYTLFGGTSGATPVVSGVAALVFATHPGWTPLQVKKRLIQTVRPVSGLKPYVLSAGVVDAAAAIQP